MPRTPPGALTDAERTVLAVVAAAARQGTRTPELPRMSVLRAAARGTPASAARAAWYALLARGTLALADPDAPLTPHPRPRGLALLPDCHTGLNRAPSPGADGRCPGCRAAALHRSQEFRARRRAAGSVLLDHAGWPV